MTEKLKPCPFCGGVPSTADWITSRLYTRDNAFCVYCPSCQLLFGFDADYGGQFATEQEAIETWNRRAQS